MKKAIASFIAFVLCVGLSISAFAGGDGNTAAAAEGEPVQLYFLMQYAEDGTDARMTRRIFERFQEEVDSRLVLNAEYISDSDSYYQKLKTLIASNEMPDFFVGDADEFTLSLRDEGLLYNVGDMLDELGVKGKFLETPIKYTLYADGTQYLLASSANLEFFWYHPSMFETAGIESPPKTWAEFYEVCDKLEAANFTAIAGPPRMSMVLRYAAMVPFRREGNAWISNVISGNGSWGDETGVAMGEHMQKMNGYFNNGWTGMDSSAMRDYFLSGGAAIWYESTGQALNYLTTEDNELIEDLSYFTMPMLDGYSGSKATDFFANPGKGIFMKKEFVEANKDLVYDFINFFVNVYGDTSVYEFNTLSGILPSNQDDMSDLFKDLYEQFGNVEEYAYVWDVVIDSVSNETLKAEIYNLILGEISPQEFGEIMDEAIAENVHP